MQRRARNWAARRVARVCAGAFGVVVVVFLLAAGLFGYMLATGPIDLEKLKPSLSHSLEEKLGGRFHVAMGPTSLVAAHGGFALGFNAIRITDLDGRTVVAAPRGRIGLDVIALLFGFEVKVRRIEFDGLAVRLRVRPDGAVSIAAASSPDAATIDFPAMPATPPGEKTPGLVALALINAMTGANQPLDHAGLEHGHLEVVNEGLGKTSVYEDFSVVFDRTSQTAKTEISARGPAGQWRLAAQARGGEAPSLSVEVRDLGLDEVRLLDAKPGPFETDMPISFKLDANLDNSGHMRFLKGAFSLGAGYFKLADPDHEPLLIDEATGTLAWDPEARRYRFDKVEALAGASHYRFDGWISPPSGADAVWRGHLQSGDILIAGERPGEFPVAISEFLVESHLDPADSHFYLDRLSLRGPHLQGQMSAESFPQGNGAALKLKVEVGPSGVADVLRLWPTFINPGARNWCLENLHAGEVASGAITVDWDAAAADAAFHDRPVPADSVHGEFHMHDIQVGVLAGLPPLTQVDASGVITGRVFEVSAKRATMDLAPGRRLQANDLFFRVPDTAPAPKVPAQAGAHLQGGADALADLLSRDVIRKYAGFAVDPANVKGQFQGNLGLDLTIGKEAKPEDQHFRADGALTALQLDKYVANERFEQGQLDVAADSNSLKITGQGLVNGVPAKIDLAKAGNEEGVLSMALTLDDAARAKLGLTTGLPMTGPMAAKLKAPLGKATADVEIDLSKAEVMSPEGGVLKPAGKPGKATFSVKSVSDGVQVTSLAVDGGSLFVRGSLQLGTDGALQSAKITQLRLASGDDLRLDLQGGPTLKATVRGASADARGFVKSFFAKEAPSANPKDLDLDMRVGSVLGENREAIEGFDLTMLRRNGVLRSLVAKGKLGHGALTAKRDDSGLLTVRAEDAGAVARFFDLYSKLEGGQLDLSMRDSPTGSRGNASIRNFTLHNESALTKMEAANPGGGRLGPDRGGQGSDDVKFDRLTASFTRQGGRLDLHEALVNNTSVGLTAQGYLDFARDQVDITGTFVPAYGVNSLVTGIPVVGVLLGGGKHEGIFGVNYHVSGPASGPTLTINPLSGVTPGILRKIMGVMDGTTRPDPLPGDGE